MPIDFDYPLTDDDPLKVIKFKARSLRSFSVASQTLIECRIAYLPKVNSLIDHNIWHIISLSAPYPALVLRLVNDHEVFRIQRVCLEDISEVVQGVAATNASASE